MASVSGFYNAFAEEISSEDQEEPTVVPVETITQKIELVELSANFTGFRFNALTGELIENPKEYEKFGK